MYVVTTPDWDENRYVSQLWLVGVPERDGERGESPRQLTFADKGSSSPRWSPDGASNCLSFTAGWRRRDAALPHGGLWRRGGALDAERDEHRALWLVAGRGRAIAYVAPAAESKADKAREKQYGDYHVEDEDDRCSHLWLIGLDERKARQLTFGDDLHVIGFDWSPQGNAIAFEGYPSSRIDDRRFGRIHHLNVESGHHQAISEATAITPLWSPDGKQLSYLQGSPLVGYKNVKLTILTLRSSSDSDALVQDSRVIASEFDEQIYPSLWREEGPLLYRGSTDGDSRLPRGCGNGRGRAAERRRARRVDDVERHGQRAAGDAPAGDGGGERDEARRGGSCCRQQAGRPPISQTFRRR